MRIHKMLLATLVVAVVCPRFSLGSEIRGVVESVAVGARVIQIRDESTGKSTIVNVTPDTVFVNAGSLRDFAVKDDVVAEIAGKETAVRLTRAVVPLGAEVTYGVDDVSALLKGNTPYVLVDARPKSDFDEGHIPGAMSIYVEDLPKQWDRLPADQGHLIVFYCSGTACGMSPAAARAASAKGYRNVRVFKDGMPGWKKAGQLVAVNPGYVATVLDEHHVILDVRSPADSIKGHLPGAVGIPLDQLMALDRDSAAKKGIPGLGDRSAPVLIYGADTASVYQAFQVVTRWGYTNVAAVEGGYAAWASGGFPIEKGSAKSSVQFTRALVMGAVSPEEFTRLVASKKAVILDVREDAEVAKGQISGAVHIPLGKLNEQIDKLSRQDEIVIHCAVGIRARMAYIRLTSAGFEHVRFLNETILVRPDGTFCINCTP